MRVKNEKELRKLGLAVDPNDSTKVVRLPNSGDEQPQQEPPTPSTEIVTLSPLPPAPADKLMALADEANAAHAQAEAVYFAGCQDALPFAIQAGEALNEAKKLCKVRRIKWGPWRDANFEADRSERTAQVYMQLARDKKLVLEKAQTSAVFSIDSALDWIKEKKGTGHTKGPTKTPAAKALAYMKKYGVTITYDGGKSVDLIGNDPHDRATMIVLSKATSTAEPAEPAHAPDDDKADEDDVETGEGEEQAKLKTYSVLWRRVAEGVVVVKAPDHEAAAAKVRQMAEQRSALENQSDSSPNVQVMQVKDAAGKPVAVSQFGELGLDSETTTAPTKAVKQKAPIKPTPTATTKTLPPRISEGFLASVETKGKVGYRTEEHQDKRWLIVAADERAAKLAVDGCTPKPATEHVEFINKIRLTDAGVCFVTAQDGTLTREFVSWEDFLLRAGPQKN